MTKKNGVNYSTQLSVISHRKGVIERLESQLKAGTKTPVKKTGVDTKNPIPLNDSDRCRIEKELEILKGRLTPRK